MYVIHHSFIILLKNIFPVTESIARQRKKVVSQNPAQQPLKRLYAGFASGYQFALYSVPGKSHTDVNKDHTADSEALSGTKVVLPPLPMSRRRLIIGRCQAIYQSASIPFWLIRKPHRCILPCLWHIKKHRPLAGVKGTAVAALRPINCAKSLDNLSAAA